MELRSSAGADFAVFGRSIFLIDSGFLAPWKRRSAERSRRYKYRIAVSMYMTELACGMPPHVTRPRPRDRTPGRSKLPLALKICKFFAVFGHWLIHPSGLFLLLW